MLPATSIDSLGYNLLAVRPRNWSSLTRAVRRCFVSLSLAVLPISRRWGKEVFCPLSGNGCLIFLH